MLNKTQLQIMLNLQEQMNSAVDSNWQELNRDWLLAAGMEAVEAISHHGWKWWKKQSPNMEQLQMELVDIWHFFLSVSIEEDKRVDILQDHMERTLNIIDFNGEHHFIGSMDIVSKLKLMISACFSGTLFLELFVSICADAGLSGEELYKQYVGKNILNRFRQQNGYKDGSYIKVWNGEEDNIHLVRIINSLDINSESFITELSNGLTNAYQELSRV